MGPVCQLGGGSHSSGGWVPHFKWFWLVPRVRLGGWLALLVMVASDPHVMGVLWVLHLRWGGLGVVGPICQARGWVGPICPTCQISQ